MCPFLDLSTQNHPSSPCSALGRTWLRRLTPPAQNRGTEDYADGPGWLFLVPKLYLGTQLRTKLSFAGISDCGVWRVRLAVGRTGTEAKCNFADNCVPKSNLGTRGPLSVIPQENGGFGPRIARTFADTRGRTYGRSGVATSMNSTKSRFSFFNEAGTVYIMCPPS